MKLKDNKSLKKMCEEHWSYIEKVLSLHNEDKNVIDKIRYHYITAMYHGYRHAVDDAGEEIESNIELEK